MAELQRKGVKGSLGSRGSIMDSITGASRGEGVGRGLMKACVLAYELNDRLGRMGYTGG